MWKGVKVVETVQLIEHRLLCGSWIEGSIYTGELHHRKVEKQNNHERVRGVWRHIGVT